LNFKRVTTLKGGGAKSIGILVTKRYGVKRVMIGAAI
jgi:hypothetical protein